MTAKALPINLIMVRLVGRDVTRKFIVSFCSFMQTGVPVVQSSATKTGTFLFVCCNGNESEWTFDLGRDEIDLMQVVSGVLTWIFFCQDVVGEN